MISIHRDTESAHHIASAMGWPVMDLRRYPVSAATLKKVPAELACRLRFVPLAFNARRVVVAVDDLFTGAYLAAHAYLLGAPYRRAIECVLTDPGALDAALERRIACVRD